MLIADVKISNLVLAMIMMICTGMTNIIYMLEEYQFLEGKTQKLPGYKYIEESLFCRGADLMQHLPKFCNFTSRIFFSHD